MSRGYQNTPTTNAGNDFWWSDSPHRKYKTNMKYALCNLKKTEITLILF